MKRKIIYLLLVFMSITLALPAQTKDRFSIEFKGETLPTALKKLEQVSGYHILFTYSDVQSYRVTATIHENTITQAVEKILENKPLTYIRKGEEYIVIVSKSVQKAPVAIRGMVVDEKQQPMPYCNVLLLTGDSVFVNGSVTKEDGTFLMTGEADVPYLLKVSYIGYTTALQIVEPKNLIQLLPDTHTLGEVTVTANRRPRMVRKGNKVLIDKLENSPYAKGNDVYSFMQFIPVLKVPLELSGEITLQESGGGRAVLLVNGKPVHVSMEAYLKNVHVENIERIEVVAHPMGEYKVEDGCGVINLILKKREDEGIQYNLSVGDSQDYRNSQYGMLSVSYTKKKTFLTSGVSVNNANNKKETTFDYRFYDRQSQTLEERVDEYRNLSFTGYLNLDYEVDNRNTLGVQVAAGGSRKDDSTDSRSSYRRLDSNRFDSVYVSQSHVTNPDRFNYLSGNLNYTLKTDKKGSVFYVDADYRLTRSDLQRSNSYAKQDETGNTLAVTDVLQEDETQINTYGLWLRYIHVFNADTRLVSGLSYYLSDTQYDYWSGQNPVDGSGVRDGMSFKDYTFSAYATLHHRWNERLNMSLGLAMHLYEADGDQKITGEHLSRNETNLLPSASLVYSPNERHYFSVDISTEVRQPNYMQLNPFRDYLSPTYYMQGNPDLESNRSYQGAFNYTFLRDYFLSFRTIYCANLATYMTMSDGDGLMVSIPVNRGTAWSENLSFRVNKNLLKNRLNVMYDIYACFNNYKNHIPQMKGEQKSVGWGTSIMANYLISEKYGWSLGGIYAYNSSKESDSNTQPNRHFVNFTLQKRFKHSNLSLGVRKYIMKGNRGDYSEQQSYAYHTYVKMPWMINVSYSVTFGNRKTRSVYDRSNSTVTSRTRM